mgnify:CR=1 FL=1
MRIQLPLTALAATVLLAACGSGPTTKATPPPPQKTETLQELREAGGVHITGVIGGLPRGQQAAFHVHEKGDCSAMDASSAGGHFNPAQQPHGRAGAGVHHAGDMDNLQADAEGVVHVDVHLRGVTLGGGAANDVAGRALVVHAAADDYRSQPAGNAGARVACAVIRVVR